MPFLTYHDGFVLILLFMYFGVMVGTVVFALLFSRREGVQNVRVHRVDGKGCLLVALAVIGSLVLHDFTYRLFEQVPAVRGMHGGWIYLPCFTATAALLGLLPSVISPWLPKTWSVNIRVVL